MTSAGSGVQKVWTETGPPPMSTVARPRMRVISFSPVSGSVIVSWIRCWIMRVLKTMSRAGTVLLAHRDAGDQVAPGLAGDEVDVGSLGGRDDEDLRLPAQPQQRPEFQQQGVAGSFRLDDVIWVASLSDGLLDQGQVLGFAGVEGVESLDHLAGLIDDGQSGLELLFGDTEDLQLVDSARAAPRRGRRWPIPSQVRRSRPG